MPAEIVVRGSGEAQAMPDRAVIRVGVNGDGSARDEAYAHAAQLAARVDAVLEAFADAIDRNLTATLTVRPRTQWRNDEYVRIGWQASRSSSLDVTDFGRLGDLIAEVAAAGADVSGPFWRLDATNPVHAEARRLAAEDARRRAEEYASPLGLRLLGVAWVAEPGLRGGGGDGGMVMHDVALGAARHGGGEETIDVTPDELTVVAQVDVGFDFAATD